MRFYCTDDTVDLEQYPYHVRDVHISDPFILADPKSRCYYTYVQFADTKRFPDVETDKEHGVFYVLESKDLIHWSKPQICFRQNNFWADKDIGHQRFISGKDAIICSAHFVLMDITANVNA